MATSEWRVLIADDEPLARRGVRQMLAAFPAFQVVAECRNGTETLSQLDAAAPDVIFLDIQMPGIDGFEVIRRRTPERMPLVVFLTAYDEFALKAFDAQAIDYLVKPVTESRFRAAMQRLTRLLGGTATTNDAGLTVPTTRGVRVLALTDIEWIEAADNYSRVWSGTRSYLLRESLGALEQRIGTAGFVRAHRQAIVRLGAVRRLARDGDDACYVVLTSGARVPVSRRRRGEIGRMLRGGAGAA